MENIDRKAILRRMPRSFLIDLPDAKSVPLFEKIDLFVPVQFESEAF